MRLITALIIAMIVGAAVWIFEIDILGLGIELIFSQWWVLPLLVILSPIIIFLIIFFYLAPNNYFFTFVPEARAKVVLRGDAVKTVLFNYKGYVMTNKGNILTEEELEEKNKNQEKKGVEKEVIKKRSDSIWTKYFGGLKFYGIWPLDDIYGYMFNWSGVTSSGEVVLKKKVIDHIYLKPDVYWAEINDAEDKDLLPLKLEVLLTLKVVNPYRALFAIENWLETVINRSKPLIRQYVAGHEFEKLIFQKQKVGEDMRKELEKADVIKGFFKKYGVSIQHIEIKEINPPDAYRDATLKEFVALQEKKAILIQADADRQRIEAVFSAVEKFGDLGKLIRTLESVEKSPLAASLSVQAVPGLQQALAGVFANSPDVSLNDIKEIKELLRQMQKNKKGE